MEMKGASSPGVLVLTTGLSKPFMRLDKYPALLKELERHMEVGPRPASPPPPPLPGERSPGQNRQEGSASGLSLSVKSEVVFPLSALSPTAADRTVPGG